MAKGDGQTLERLFIELGLDLSKLQTDILAADKTVTENLGRLNREKNVIKLRMEADIASLDRVKDAAKILEIQEKALNQQLALQKDRMNILEAAYRQVASNANSTAVAVNKAEQAFLREKIAVGQLEQQLKALASQKGSPAPTNSLLSGYQNLKGNVAGTINEITSALNGLQGASNSVDGALTSVLGIVGRIPPTAAAATAVLVGIPLIFKGIENSIVDLSKAAAASGDATYVMSRGMQMSIADAAKFSTNAKVAGAQVNDLAMAVKNVQRQVARGGEDSRSAEWLKRYGESAYDASGNLKDLNEMTFALSRALKRAQADGKGAEFVLNVFRNVSADAITAIEDWADVNAQAASIVKAGLANPKLAHEVQGNLNAMNVQSAQLGTSFTNALLPVSNEIIPRLTERMGKLTLLIRDNKGVILDLGKDFADVWGAVESTIDNVVEGVSVLGKLARQNRVVRQTDTQTVVERYKDDKSVQNSADLLKKEIAAGSYIDEDIARLRSRSDLYQRELKRTEADIKAIWTKRREEFAEANKPIIDKYKYDNSIKSATDLLHKLTDTEKETIEKTTSAFGSMQERTSALYKELQKVREEAKQAQVAVDEFKSVAESFSSAGQERRLIGEDQIEQLRAFRKYQEEADEILYKLSHTDYESKKFGLSKWLQEQLPRDTEQSMAKYKAVMEKYSALDKQIEQERAEKLKEIRDSVAAIDKTALQNKLDIIEKERQTWLKAGMDEAESIELTQNKIAKAYEETNKKIQEYWKNAADIEFELTHTAFEKQIRDIEQWEEAMRDKADTAEEIAGIIAESAAKEAQAFEREVERIKGVTQSLEDEIFDMEHSQYEADIRRAMQKYQKAIEDGVDFSVAQRWLNDKLKGFNTRAKESKASDGDYTKNPNGKQSAIQWQGLSVMQSGIGLMTDENQIRRRLITTLDESAQAEVERIQSLKSQSPMEGQIFGQSSFLGAPIGATTIIEGDEVTQISLPDLKAEMEKMQRQMAETFGVTMPDISQYMPAQSSVQLPAQETMTFETIVTPLNNIHTVVSNILSALGNRQPPQITVSNSISNNLGGAYVFDNEMKKQLVDDITSDVVDEITQAVTQATSRANYSYGA